MVKVDSKAPGTLEGMTLIRYDNAHEETKGHEKHTGAVETTIDFHGIEPLLIQFYSEADVYWDEFDDADGPVRPFETDPTQETET